MTADRRWVFQATGPGRAPQVQGDLVCFSLEAAPERLEELHQHLSADERARAARFRFERPRNRFIVARGRLRELLASRLGVAPAALRFRYGPHGKPELDGEASDSELRFNLSHSGSIALAGFCRSRELGVDIECWRALRDARALARRYFAPSEQRDFLSLPEAGRTEGFFNGWSRKEAFIKALGRGLSLPLDSFEVELRPGYPAALRSWQREPGDTREWCLAVPDDIPGRCAAAIVVEAEGCHIRVA